MKGFIIVICCYQIIIFSCAFCYLFVLVVPGEEISAIGEDGEYSFDAEISEDI